MAIPAWAVGRHVTACTITPQSLASGTAGWSFSDVASLAQTYYGHLENIEVVQEIDHEEINHMAATRKHNVYIEEGTTFRLTELEKSINTNLAALLWNSGVEYCKLIITRGAQSWTGYGAISAYNMEGQKRGVKAQLNFLPVDIGTKSPTYG